MTAIERTAYPTFARAPQPKELLTLYTPTSEDVAFVSTTARGPSQKFALVILLKVFQKLGYFVNPNILMVESVQLFWWFGLSGISSRSAAPRHSRKPAERCC